MKRAFTLAEAMMTFVVIGILAMVLLPTLLKAGPEQAELRAKKAYNTIHRVLDTMTTSGPYDLSEGTLEASNFVFGTTTAQQELRNSFFCNAVADLLNTRDVDCSMDKVNAKVTSTCTGGFSVSDGGRNALCASSKLEGSVLDYSSLRDAFDSACDSYFNSTTASDYNIKTADGVLWSIQRTNFTNQSYLSIDGVKRPSFYNVICIDTDKHKTIEHMYGLGVNKDGNIIAGTKLQELADAADEDY